MKPAKFRYSAPESLDEALELLQVFGPDCKIMAGGQSLMALMNLRMARPDVVVDIGGVPGLGDWRQANGAVVVGAMVRQRALERDAKLKGALPLLAEAVGHIGHVATRSRGTIIGSLCHADPAAELPLCALALDAEFMLRSARRERTVAADDFFVDIFESAAEPDELVEGVRFPALDDGAGYAFVELARRHGDFALVAVAGLLGLGADGRIGMARLVLGGVDTRPVRARQTEEALIGQPPSEELFREAGQIAATNIAPASDLHATARYRTSVTAVLVERALQGAVSRASGKEG